MWRLSLYVLIITLSSCASPVKSQYSITASEVETWRTKDFPSSDFNLNSAYIYLLNGPALQEVFTGDDLDRSERRELDLKRGDYPQYMYLAIILDNPMNDKEPLTVPMMIHDVRDPQNQSRIIEYGGRFLENIPDEVLKDGDITARVKFEAIKDNNNSEFWKQTAKISIDLGKTATSLLSSPLTGALTTLTDQIIPQVDQGLRSMGQIEDPEAMTSEFYIRLFNKELSALYREQVVSATLYRIHWDIDNPPSSRFFRKDQFNSVDAVRDAVKHNNTPFILVVNTKSEYNTDHSELAYTQQYIQKKSNEFRKIRNLDKKEIEKAFLENLKIAAELRKQIDEFQSSLNTKYPDWSAYSRIIDLYYDLRLLQQEQQPIIAMQQDQYVQDKYSRLYANVLNDVSLWFTTELLVKGREIGDFLIEQDQPYREQAVAKTARQIYADIELLDFYRDRVKQTQIQGKLPKEIESLESYSLVNRKLSEIENILFEREFQAPPSLTPQQQKDWLTDKVTRSFPKCQVCAQRVGEEITRIENATHEQNIQQYKQIVATYYNELDCYERIFQRLEEFIQVNTDSLTVSPFMLASLKQDRERLIRLSSTYTEIIGQDYRRMLPKELSDLLSQYYLNREKLTSLIRRLQPIIFDGEEESCLRV